MGVRLVNLGEGQSLVAIARNAEATAAEAVIDAEAESESDEDAEIAESGAETATPAAGAPESDDSTE
ncbi:MAG: hypothetical protein WAL16_00705, partial [Streptosporangiaceae bacterium]